MFGLNNNMNNMNNDNNNNNNNINNNNNNNNNKIAILKHKTAPEEESRLNFQIVT